MLHNEREQAGGMGIQIDADGAGMSGEHQDNCRAGIGPRAQEAKDRLREIIEGFFFQRLRTEDGNDAASVAASSTSTP